MNKVKWFAIWEIACYVTLSINQIAAQEIAVTGKRIDINGETKIPKALLGVHKGGFDEYDASTVADWGIESERGRPGQTTAPVTPAAGIDDMVTYNHDRYEPIWILDKRGSWQSETQSLAQMHVDHAATLNVGYHVEFWNEPYLHWGYKPGIVTDPQFYESEGVNDGDPVYIKGASEPCEFLVWRDDQIWFDSPRWAQDKQNVYQGIAGVWNYFINIDSLEYRDPDGMRKFLGNTYKEGSSREFTVIETMRPVDTTQTSYYAARQGCDYYNQMYGVFAGKIKELNPDIKMVAGWGFNMHIDDWTPWETLVKPLIDEHHDLIDGINEHHYRTDPRIVAADYETIYGYANQKYGKRFRFYNTETAGYLDPQASNQANSPTDGLSDAEKGLYAFTYHTRDILYMMSRVPDKAFARAAHEPQKSNGGVETAFKFLKPLRGELMQAESNDNDIWSVAAKNDNALIVVLFCDKQVSQTVDLTVTAPAGRSLTGGQRRWVTIDNGLSIKSSNVSASGAEYAEQVSLEPMSPVMFVFDLSGSAIGSAPVYYTQFFADTVLMHVQAQAAATTTITLEQADLNEAASARLRYVLADASGGETLTLNGTPLSLSPGVGIRYATIDKSALSPNNVLTVTAGSNNVRLWSAAIELMSDETPVTARQAAPRAPAPVNPVAIAALGTTVRVRPGGVSKPVHVALYDLSGRLVRARRTAREVVFDTIGAGNFIVQVIADEQVIGLKKVMLTQ